MTKKTNLNYKTESYQVLMPESRLIRTVIINKLANKKAPKTAPITKVTLPVERGFFRGVEYEENNTLLEYPDKSWEKMTSIQFGDGAETMFGTTEIEKTGPLTKADKAVLEAVG